MTINAKKEFISHVETLGTIVCANVQLKTNYYGPSKNFILKPNYTQEEYQIFLNSLDFTYENGYGSQKVFGYILFIDSHSERGEYDGSEWWRNIRKPSIEEVMNYLSYDPADLDD